MDSGKNKLKRNRIRIGSCSILGDLSIAKIIIKTGLDYLKP